MLKICFGALETALKRVIKKTVDLPGNLIGNKIADKITGATLWSAPGTFLSKIEDIKLDVPAEKSIEI